jgi:hypothetical protein
VAQFSAEISIFQAIDGQKSNFCLVSRFNAVLPRRKIPAKSEIISGRALSSNSRFGKIEKRRFRPGTRRRV